VTVKGISDASWHRRNGTSNRANGLLYYRRRDARPTQRDNLDRW